MPEFFEYTHPDGTGRVFFRPADIVSAGMATTPDGDIHLKVFTQNGRHRESWDLTVQEEVSKLLEYLRTT